MGWRPGREAMAGDEPRHGASPAGSVGRPAAQPGLLSEFAHGGRLDGHPPSAGLAAALEKGLAEAGCTGASRDELVGMLRGWAALEAWASAGRLAVLRALIQDEAREAAGGFDPDVAAAPRVGWPSRPR